MKLKHLLLLVCVGIEVIFVALRVDAQNISIEPQNTGMTLPNAAQYSVAGTWTYRSYHNRPAVIVDDDAQSAQKMLQLLFGEGIFTLRTTSTTIAGTFDMGGGTILDIDGTMQPASANYPAVIRMFGRGRSGTPTDGWEYDYVGYLTPRWPNGINQVPSIVGTVIRAKPHNGAPAGYVASFIASKQP
jgi:hypothetical protein